MNIFVLKEFRELLEYYNSLFKIDNSFFGKYRYGQDVFGGLHTFDDAVSWRKFLLKIDKLHEKIKNKLVLDIGSGRGESTKALYESSANEVISLDIDKDNLKSSAIKNPVLASAHYLPFRKNSFDFITAFYFFDIVFNPRSIIRDIKDILKDNGIFYFNLRLQFENSGKPFIVSSKLTKNKKILEENFYNLDPLQQFKKILEKEGYTIVSISKLLKEISFLAKK